MEISIREREGVAIFDIEGRIIGEESLALKQRINKYIDSVGGNRPKILLNLEGVPMLDSTGLGILVVSHATVIRRNGQIGLVGLNETISKLISMTKLTGILNIYENEDAAIQSLR